MPHRSALISPRKSRTSRYPSEFVGRSTNRKMVVLNAHEHEDLFHYGLKTFLQEAQTIAQLRHPHLVRVINFFELNDTAYLVMDYYEGEDLGRHLKPPRRGQPGVQLPWRRAVNLMLPVLDGLQKVHQAGFMHRDIKPGNLYLTRDDELILLDFGSARQVSGTHTRSLLIFSEGFAPYEQYLQGHLNRQGPWTDVYAVAATLYFMLTAHRVPSALDRKQAELLQQPDLLKPARQVIPDLPLALDAALLRALAVEPEQRLQSIAAFKQHLETALAEEDEPRPPPRPPPPPPPPPEPPTQHRVAPKPPIPPKAVPVRPVKPLPEAPSPPKTTLERSGQPNWRVAAVVIAMIGLIAWGGWSIGLRTSPDSLKPPVIVTPPVAESSPVAATPPVVEPEPIVEPHAYLTVKATPATAQIRIMNIGPAYRDGIELTPGDFDLEVSAPGYQTYRAWRHLAAGAQELPIALQAESSAPAAPSRSSFEPDLVRILAGCFQMGSPASEANRDSDERQHRVCVSSFEIGKYEVTQGQWQAVMGDNPSYFKHGDDYPVEWVSWNDIQAYLEKLNARTGRKYRLPTEAEWEYACRGGVAGQRYCGGDDPARLAWYGDNSGAQTHPVGRKAANSFGLYDLSGNVWEWTCSLYDKDYQGAEKDCNYKDTSGLRSLRGGSWLYFPAWVRSASRGWLSPTYRVNGTGFRLARSL